MQSETPRTRRSLGRATKGVLVAGVLLAVLSACQTPIQPQNRPTVPAGQTNGALNPGLLVNIFGCVIHRDAANSLGAMSNAARAEGITVFASSCYRDYAGQVAARQNWCNQGACHMAAVPGSSNHGWGKAVDISTQGSMTFNSPAYHWLKKNAWLYGWNHPGWAEPGGSSPEPWHWEWVGDGGTMYPGMVWGPR